jgi:hypothetical protein
MELAVLEGLKAVESDGLGERAMRAMELMEELAVAPESVGVEQDGLGRGFECARELTETGAGARPRSTWGSSLGRLSQ